METRLTRTVQACAGSIGDMRLEVIKVIHAGDWRPISDDDFICTSYVNRKIYRVIYVYVKRHHSQCDLRLHTMRCAKKAARKGDLAYVFAMDLSPMQPFDYECIMDWLSPCTRANICNQQNEILLVMDRLNIASDGTDVDITGDDITGDDITGDDIDYFCR